MWLRYRPLLLIPLVCAGGPAAVACDGFGPSCVGAGQRCSHVLPNCCGALVCTDTPSNIPQCQKATAQSAEALRRNGAH